MEITRAAGAIGIPGLYVTDDPGIKEQAAKHGNQPASVSAGQKVPQPPYRPDAGANTTGSLCRRSSGISCRSPRSSIKGDQSRKRRRVTKLRRRVAANSS
jgi:hypothetical protein